MTTIILYGEKDDTSIEKLIQEKLTDRYRIISVCENEISCIGKGYEILVVSGDKLSAINVHNAIIIFKTKAKPLITWADETCSFIVNSYNTEQLKAVVKFNHIITCGPYSYDSLSYSSISGSSIVVSLNREIDTLSGKKIQPLEIPIEISKEADSYSYIAFTALRLLLDDFKSDIGKLY